MRKFEITVDFIFDKLNDGFHIPFRGFVCIECESANSPWIWAALKDCDIEPEEVIVDGHNCIEFPYTGLKDIAPEFYNKCVDMEKNNSQYLDVNMFNV